MIPVTKGQPYAVSYSGNVHQISDSHIEADLSVAGPSNADYVNFAEQPSEQHVCASRSQASLKYGKFRNQQCACNSLTFLAFLYENENITEQTLTLFWIKVMCYIKKPGRGSLITAI